MLVAFFLYETFKEDVCSPVVEVSAYATTVRRKVIDIAAKLVQHAGKTILKVTEATWRALNVAELWLIFDSLRACEKSALRKIS
jgi:hypothetical protein